MDGQCLYPFSCSQTIYCLISSSRYFIAVALGCCEIIRLFTAPESCANVVNSMWCRGTGKAAIYAVMKSHVQVC